MSVSLEDRLSTWKEFLEHWKVDDVKNLTLPQYINVNNHDTFAYWLEHKTRILGSIRGGSAVKFGIYRRNKAPKGLQKHIQHGKEYSWHIRFGKDETEAFENVKESILKVIEYIQKGDLKSIENINIADTLKWKVAFLYQNQKDPLVINIFKRDMLREACADPTADFAELYENLLEERKGRNIVAFGQEIWTSLENESDEIESDLGDENTSELEIVAPSLNSILYGPPGTGKTYSTINKALEILDPEFLNKNVDNRDALKTRFDELLKNNRIGFVTFHQSFSYEDFVEGIKADTENGQVHYSIEDGIFKSMCEGASVKVQASSKSTDIDVSARNIWKMSLGDTQGEDAYIYQQCIDNDYIVLGYGYKLNFSSANTRIDIMNIYNENGAEITNASKDYSVTSVYNFKKEMAIGDLVVISDGNHKFRAIAEITSNYSFDDVVPDSDGYSQCRKVKWLKVFSQSVPKDELLNSNFSQMTLYRLRPPVIDLDKLGKLINDNSVNTNGLSVGSLISGYKVLSISPEIIELRKPNGSNLPIARSIINELKELVLSSQITIEDIKQKQVFDKVHTQLEKYMVNGYQTVFAALVSEIIKNGIVTDNSSIPDKRVLIIDEINRGNIANIFGELITLIEPSKRAGGSESLSVKLPYSKQPFSVPSNLHIIGTMNTADKSLAQVDIALRRRFEFIEMMPNYSVLEDISDIDGINIRQLLETINQRIELLYDREHMIGHSFFLPLKKTPTITKLARIFELQILPLLEEYFFEDWERVGQVLGDHRKDDQSLHFIIEKFNSNTVITLMGKDWEQTGIQPYQRNQQALDNPQAYIGIYETITNA